MWEADRQKPGFFGETGFLVVASLLRFRQHRFGILKLSGAAVEVFEDDLWPGEGDPAFAAELFGVVEDVVDLHDAVVRVAELVAGDVGAVVG